MAIPNDPNCGQFAESAIVWTANNMADGAAWPKPASDQAFTVTITNAKVARRRQNFTYQVTVIDPATSDPSHTLSQAPQGPARPTVNQNPGYTATAVADASGYQWRTSTLTPGNVFDDAEDGIGNWTPTIVGGYDPVSTARASTGTSSFRLAAGSVVSGSPPAQVLTLEEDAAGDGDQPADLRRPLPLGQQRGRDRRGLHRQRRQLGACRSRSTRSGSSPRRPSTRRSWPSASSRAV